ncbi:MAG: hypothetical protein QOJ56_2804 [Mycobacterium sp.]|nr:hypothetical protein [Mycobacterium sp.]MDT5354272.1 hypothetical protein [Mycobacterium sp.]
MTHRCGVRRSELTITTLIGSNIVLLYYCFTAIRQCGTMES